MKDLYPRLRELGAEVLAISFFPPPRLRAFLQDFPLPFPLLADPERNAYRAFGLGKTSWSAILRPGSVLRYLKLLFGGWRPGPAEKNDDLIQLGGDFILDCQGRLLYAYPSKEPTDRPSAAALLEAVRKAISPEH